MTENDISRILRHAVPREPRMAGLGDRVRGGHRRRRIAQGAAAAVGVVALGLPLALQLGDTMRTDPPLLATPSANPTAVTSEPPTTPTAEPTAPGAPRLADAERLQSEVCEDAQGTVSEFVDATIPDGVVALHLCSNDQEAAIPVFGAAEPIVVDASAVIARVNDAPELSLPPVCETEGDGRFGYVVVLEYADGERLVVNTSNVDCLPVVGDGAGLGRGDSQQFFDDVLGLLREQRQTYDYSYVGDQALCLEAESILQPSLDDMVRGAACGVDPSSDSPDEGLVRHVLPDDVAAEVVAEATANSEPAPAHGLPLFSQTLVLQTAHGDPLTLYRWPDGSFYYRTADAWMMWTPSTDLAAELALHFEGTRAEPFQEPLPPELCMDPDLQWSDGPLSAADSAEACVQVSDGVHETHSMPSDLWVGFLASLVDGATTVPLDEPFEFTGHWIALLDDEGHAHQLFVTDTGDLVWDEPKTPDVRRTATPPAEVLDWMESVGIDVQR